MKTFQQIQEGVYDPNIFNAIFLAGGPGSGKSYVVRKTTGGLGLKILNSDDIYEKDLEKAGLDIGKPEETKYIKELLQRINNENIPTNPRGSLRPEHI